MARCSANLKHCGKLDCRPKQWLLQIAQHCDHQSYGGVGELLVSCSPHHENLHEMFLETLEFWKCFSCTTSIKNVNGKNCSDPSPLHDDNSMQFHWKCSLLTFTKSAYTYERIRSDFCHFWHTKSPQDTGKFYGASQTVSYSLTLRNSTFSLLTSPVRNKI